MITTLNFLYAISKPINSIKEARAFIRYLVKRNKNYHFDDDAREVVSFNKQTGKTERVFTDHQANILNQRMKEIFSFDNWGSYGCPHGYHLHYAKKIGKL